MKTRKSEFRCAWIHRFVMLILICQGAPATPSQAQTTMAAGDLNSLLGLAQTKSESFQAIEQSIQSLQAEIKARDLELSSVLTIDASDTHDDRASLSQQKAFSHSQLFKTTFEKPFTSGTRLGLQLNHQILDYTASGGDRNSASWELSLAQDLWRNAWGRSTRLRRAADQAELLSRKFDLQAKKQQLIVDLEKIYWDLSLAFKEEQIRLGNIERSESLEKWIRGRVRKFAAESTDLLQIQALISQRKLEVLDTRNRIADLENQLRQLIPDPAVVPFKPDLSLLEVSREPSRLVMDASDTSSKSAKDLSTPLNLTALTATYRFRQAEFETQKIDENLKPSLQAYITHGRNGIEDTFPDSWQTASTDDYMGTTIGLRLSLELDFDLKSERRKASELAAEARRLEAEAQNRKSLLVWRDLARQIDNLKLQADEAKKLSGFQLQKATEEHKRYRQGRTTAFQVITFETDAATAELRYYQTLSNLRKLESLARGFVFESGASQ